MNYIDYSLCCVIKNGMLQSLTCHQLLCELEYKLAWVTCVVAVWQEQH